MDPATPIGLKEAAKLVPGRPTYPTLLRWVRRGVRTPAGGRVKLAAAFVGGRWFTTGADLDAFAAATTAARGATPRPAGDARAARRRELAAVLGGRP